MTDTDILSCGVGYFNNVGTAEIYCQVCTAGYYCPDARNINPTPCPKQTYSAEGAEYCTICPVGTMCPIEGISDTDL